MKHIHTKGDLILDYGWNDPITLCHWLPEPKEITKTRNMLDGLGLLKPNSHSIIWDTISSSVEPFYTGYKKDSIFDYKPFKKWVSKPLLSCEYALMLNVLKTS